MAAMPGKSTIQNFGNDLLSFNFRNAMLVISIITINFNDAKGLQKTLDSVHAQTYKKFEHIIIDGGSMDGSVDIINRNSDRFSYHVSEKDKGIYNAMNKGILQAKGTYCLFLNSGDYFFEKKSLEKILPDLAGADIVGANPVLIYGNRLVENYYPKHVTKDFMLRSTLLHQATFIKTSLLFKLGLYNEQNRIVSDWEFFLRAFVLENCSFKKSNVPLCVFNRDGMSMQPENQTTLKNEQRAVIQRLLPHDLELYDLLLQNKSKKTLLQKVKKLAIRSFQYSLRIFGIQREYFVAQM